MATRLIELAQRAVIFDPVLDYAPGPTGVVVWSGQDALRALADRWDEPFRIVVRAETVDEYAAVASLVERVQREPGAGPITVVLEEAAVTAGNTFNVPEPISRLYRLGRRWRVNCVAVTQIDTDVHRVFRANTHIWVLCKTLKLSTDFSKMFDLYDAMGLTEIAGPGVRPEPGVHYLTVPASADLFGDFARANYW